MKFNRGKLLDSVPGTGQPWMSVQTEKWDAGKQRYGKGAGVPGQWQSEHESWCPDSQDS